MKNLKLLVLLASLFNSFHVSAQTTESSDIAKIELRASSSTAQFGDSDGEGKTEWRILGRKWSTTFYSLASFEEDKFRDQGGRLGTYNYFSFHTFLSGPYRFSLRLPFTYGSAGTDRFDGSRNNEQELLIQDPILETRNPELMYLPWDVGVYWAARVYLPVSKQSKLSGQIARFRHHVALTKVLSRTFSMEVQNRYYYSWQSRTAYRTSFEDELGFPVNDVAVATKQHEVENWLTLWGRITPKTGLGVQAITEDSFYHKSPANNDKYKEPARSVAIGPVARFPLNDSVNFIFSYGDKVDREENLDELGRFLSKNTEYVLHSFVNF